MRACEASIEVRRDGRSGRDTHRWALQGFLDLVPGSARFLSAQEEAALSRPEKLGKCRVYKCEERLLKALLRSSAFLWCWFSVKVSQPGTRQQGRV